MRNQDEKSKNQFGRRDLLKGFSLATAAALGGAGAIAGEGAPRGKRMMGVPFESRASVRVGFVGVGGRGTGLLENVLAIDGVTVSAVCDISAAHAGRAQSLVEKAGGKKPEAYTATDHDYEKLLSRDDIDLAVIATPWRWHVPMAVFAMKHGTHAAVEVPAAGTIKECWDLVNTSEETRRHCVMLENCCYGYNELMVLDMVRAGLLGELTHGACAYNHDLRALLLSDRGEGLWRRFDHLSRNGNLYPTHGLGPVARYMNVNHGDRFDYMVSMSSPAKGLAEYRKEHLPAGDPKMKEVYRCGDLNTSLIRTATGLLITLEHNVTSPQPYDRINLIAGTKGIFRDYPPRIYIDGQTKNDEFETIDRFKAQYEHALWTNIGELARKLGGHGGMDFIMLYRLMECMKKGLPPDMDVYDAAAWSAPGPLSEQSVAAGSAPVRFPDFTRGGWESKTA